MEMAKVTSKGQITIPVSIRRRLGINEGDKLLFLEKPDGVMMVNPNSLQIEWFDDVAASQPSGADAQPATPPSDAANRFYETPQAPQAKGESQNKPSAGFDVAALLNEIRTMGSKI